jgi:hypothetical protein
LPRSGQAGWSSPFVWLPWIGFLKRHFRT